MYFHPRGINRSYKCLRPVVSLRVMTAPTLEGMSLNGAFRDQEEAVSEYQSVPLAK